MPRRFNRPAATGGNGFARYDYKWANLGIRISTEATESPLNVWAAFAPLLRVRRIGHR